MAEVLLNVGGHAYRLSCGEGEEARLHELAARIDSLIGDHRERNPGLGVSRELFFAALSLADQVDELESKQSSASEGELPLQQDPAAEQGHTVRIIEQMTGRIEKIASDLEKALDRN